MLNQRAESGRGERAVGTADPTETRVRLMAVEHGLTRTQLHRLAAGSGEAKELDAWLAEQLEGGVVVPSATTAGAFGIGRGQRFLLRGDLAQHTVRQLAAEGRLEVEVERGRALFGARSFGDVTLALQCGDLAAFERRLARHGKLAPAGAASWLRESVCEAFDPVWLERTYGAQTPVVVARVLTEALAAPAACDSLFRWAQDVSLEGTRAALCQQAIFRGDPDGATRHLAGLPPRDAAGFEAAAAFVRGDLVAAHAALDAPLATKTRPPSCGYVAPLLALLLLERGDGAVAAARRWVTAAERAGAAGTAKPFRLFLRLHQRREGDDRALPVHQLPPDAGPWTLLLTAFTAHFRVEREATRAGWAVALLREGKHWSRLGYAWLGEQARLLAAELRPRGLAEVEALGAGAFELGAAVRATSPEPAHGTTLSLWDRLAPRPAWKRALEALANLSSSVARTAETAYRVAWFVDMPSARLGRPMLERFDANEGGWTAGRRVALSELEAVASQLPAEDREVMRRLAGREGELAALEALVGHDRVFSGARGTKPVVVSRGRCRVETRDVPGGVAVAVEPQGAREGLHAVAVGDDHVVVYRVDTAFERLARTLPEGLYVPREGESELLAVLADLATGVEVIGPHLAAEETLPAAATPCLRVAVQAGAYVAQVGVRPFGAQGRWLVAGEGPHRLRLVVEGRRLQCERDFDRERRERAALLAACPSLTLPDEGEELWSFDEVGLLGLLAELRRAEVPHALEWRGARGLLLAGSVSRASLQGHLRSVKRWYLAEGKARLDEGAEATLAELARAPTLAGGRFLRIAPGTYVEVETQLLRAMAALRAAAREGAGLRLHGAALPSLEALIDGPLEADDATRRSLARFASVSGARYRLPRGLEATLRDYQLAGYRWLRTLCDLEIGACLADDMGLGKTVQIIALLLAQARRGSALVVAPTSVCSNWLRELHRFAPGLEVVEHLGPERAGVLSPRRGQVFVTSYAILQQDADVIANARWEVAVLDEAQLIKNAASQRARAAYRLQAHCRIAATGTPVENHVGDLWAIFRFLNPGLLGDWKNFRRAFVRPIERDGSIEAREALRSLLGGYVLRRLKQDVLTSLPPLTEVVLEVDLDETETALHTVLQRDIREKLEGVRGRRGHEVEVLAAITRLRRFCCHARLAFPEAEVGSSKVEALLELVEELRENGHRALVFSQFVGFLDLVREHLDERRIGYEYLDGSTPRTSRQARVDAFQEGEATLFVISLKAGGFGLNLTGADYVIHLDPWWNPAVEAQATDRAHRIGQTRPVTVYRLVTRGTIEEKILTLQDKKRELADAVLDGSDVAALTTEELLALLEDSTARTGAR